ncbi:MAG: NAD(P)/FAD-dependent oxidoreductase [Bacteroidetes bacterium]|nr:NAD(P)/FAD-dependent oxidoreductase [Bacteroidota bacterium]
MSGKNPVSDILILGGGAAGFFAAVNAAELDPSLKIAIIERSEKLLSKVRISGGGRCNVTHACFDNNLLSEFYPRGNKELPGPFSRFSVKETIAWFEKRKVKLKTEEDGRMFPVTNDSATIVNCLLDEARKRKIQIHLSKSINSILKKKDYWEVTANEEEVFTAKKLLIATGGSPKIGNYSLIASLGHSILPPLPSLFTFNLPENKITELMGVSVENAEVKIGGTKIITHGPLLITHWGMSGPAVLKASAFGATELAKCNYNFTAIINWTGKTANEIRDEIIHARKKTGSVTVFSSNNFHLPKRLWHFLLVKCGIHEEHKWADLASSQMEKLGMTMLGDQYEVKGKTTFKDEFVTCGGVELKEIDFRTMESKLRKDLFFAGEVVNIDALTGGFNFQAAWTTGFIAANGMVPGGLSKGK